MEPTLRVDTALQGAIIHAGSEALGSPPLFLRWPVLRHIHRSTDILDDLARRSPASEVEILGTHFVSFQRQLPQMTSLEQAIYQKMTKQATPLLVRVILVIEQQQR
jgi:hypothetical protein